MPRLKLILIVLLTFATSANVSHGERPISFNRDVRPILSDRCFACHGPDAETVEGGLRLDSHDDATADGAIVAGDADDSEILRRILSEDEDEVMPPAELHKPLDEEQISILRRWINEGAVYEPHWAYKPLKRGEVPKTTNDQWSKNALDRFISARFQEEAVEPSPPADPVTLIRRLSFDLTGMPPTAAEVKAFVDDPSEEAYQALVKRLLSSDRYGERMAIYWLDLVRYADTVGYHGDQNISQSPYRDYVISAFNKNMPYDRFVREQLAGDLLSSPTRDQLIASGYNRLNQTTEEGGAQPKEYLAIYFADRVRNVSQVFMGATVGCAQCHDHKYDPYTAKDFYSLGAFFADIEEVGKYSARQRPPVMPVPNKAQQEQLADLQAQITAAEKSLKLLKQNRLSKQKQWEVETVASVATNKSIESLWFDDQQTTGGSNEGLWTYVTADQSPVHSNKRARMQTGKGTVQHFFRNAKKSIKVGLDTTLFAWVYLDPNDPPRSVMLQWNDGKSWDHRVVWGTDQIAFGRRSNSWAGYQRKGELPKSGQWVRLEAKASEVGFKPGSTINGMAFTQQDGTAFWDETGWISSDSSTPPEVVELLRLPSEARNKEQQEKITKHFFSVDPPTVKQATHLEELRYEKKAVEEQVPTAVITRSVKPRPIRLLSRGNWMDETGEFVQPAIPEFLGSLSTDGKRATRLDLANWLCESDNVLTSRTMANRLWYLMFGRGICSSVDDFGGQGTFPSHPELLDFLAVEFVESGWDIKHVMELIANSAAYRQSSKPSPTLREVDPYNELIARQGRFRVSAEMVRDTVLSLSGLLVEQVGGPSTKP